jgi:hypothetical protein
VSLSDRERAVALEILAYLAMHPEAKDSLRGIRSWWLKEPDDWTAEEVQRAAGGLVDRGLLRNWASISGSPVFGPTREFLQGPEKSMRALRSRS